MGALRQARSFNLDGSNDQSPGTYTPSMGQSLPTLIVMIVVLFIIMAFCFWGAPAVRAFCRRRVCCCCPMDEPNIDNVLEDELQEYILVSQSKTKSKPRGSISAGARRESSSRRASQQRRL